MTERNGPQAGGVILAAAILAGAIIGVIAGQSSIGVLAGAAVGVVAVTLVWWRDRAKRGD
jgi:hypothetical protein